MKINENGTRIPTSITDYWKKSQFFRKVQHKEGIRTILYLYLHDLNNLNNAKLAYDYKLAFDNNNQM